MRIDPEPARIDAEVTDARGEDGISLLHQFGMASVLVIAGVVLSAAMLLRPVEEIRLELPPLPVATWLNGDGPRNDSWSELGERAFAAGRVSEPVSDNALYYYQQALLIEPDNVPARDAFNEVIAFVVNEAETAIFESDWGGARRAAQHVLAVMPGHGGAQGILRRAQRFERIDELTLLAVNQLATERLTGPGEDNALASYREIQRLDRDNAEALVGIETVAQRLLAQAQSATLAGDFEAANTLMDRAREAAPDLVGIEQAEEMTGRIAALSQAEEAAANEAALAAAEPPAAASQTAARVPVLGISELEVLEQPAPRYPRGAQRGRTLEGWVELNFRIAPSGRVFDAIVVRSSDGVFEQSALDAIDRWRFAPYLVDGTATEVRSGLRFSFEDTP